MDNDPTQWNIFLPLVSLVLTNGEPELPNVMQLKKKNFIRSTNYCSDVFTKGMKMATKNIFTSLYSCLQSQLKLKLSWVLLWNKTTNQPTDTTHFHISYYKLSTNCSFRLVLLPSCRLVFITNCPSWIKCVWMHPCWIFTSSLKQKLRRHNCHLKRFCILKLE